NQGTFNCWDLDLNACYSWLDRRVGEGQAESRCQFAGQATSRQCVTAVWGDVDIENGIFKSQCLTCVFARLAVRRIQGDDAGVLLISKTQLRGRTDHACRHASVSFTSRDREIARQHSARKGHDNGVAFLEVAGATNDGLQFAGSVGVANIDVAVADGLLELGELFDGFHAAENEWSGGFRD